MEVLLPIWISLSVVCVGHVGTKCHIDSKYYKSYESCMDSQKLEWTRNKWGSWKKHDSPVDNKDANCILINGKSYLPESGVIK